MQKETNKDKNNPSLLEMQGDYDRKDQSQQSSLQSAKLENPKINDSDEEREKNLHTKLNPLSQGIHNDESNSVFSGTSQDTQDHSEQLKNSNRINQVKSKYSQDSSQQQEQESLNYQIEPLEEGNMSQLCSTLSTHVSLLLKKNFLVNQRHKYIFIFHYLTPLAVLLLLILWQIIANMATQFLVMDPEMIEDVTIPKCFSPEYINSQDIAELGIPTEGNKRGCTSVGYYIVGERQLWVDQAMEYVAKRNNLIFGEDVKLISQGNPSKIKKYLGKHLNRTQIGVVFCTSSYPLDQFGLNFEVPCSINLQNSDGSSPWYFRFFSGTDQFKQIQNAKTLLYTILYNYTLNYKTPYLTDPKASVGKDDLIRALKTSLDSGLAEIVANNEPNEFMKVFDENKSIEEQRLNIDFNSKRIEVISQDYPKIPTRFAEGYNVFSGTGAFYLFIPIMISFILLINEILREKEKKLRQGLTTIGLSHFSYITSWVLYSVITMALLQITMISCGIFFEFEFFTRSPVLVTFSVLFSFGLSFLAIGFFITTLCSDVKVGYTVAYSFLLFSIVMAMFMTAPVFIFYLYNDQANLFVIAVRRVFSLYPAFHFSKLFHDIAQRTNKHFDFTEARWILGPGFDYADIFNGISGKFPFPPTEYHTPTVFCSFIYLNLTSILFFVLGWYCDHVVSSNRGTQESPLFFLQRNYWRCLRRNQLIHRRVSKHFHAKRENELEGITLEVDQTVKMEKEEVINSQLQETPVNGIRVVGLSKTYCKYPFGIRSKGDKKAIDEIFFEIRENELISLLGHNGAGKSTLIGVLTGLLAPTEGTAIISGYDIRSNMDKIRKMMGVCPQFDILWDELTVKEHLEMFSRIKGINPKHIDQEINKRLADVLLLEKKDYRISTLSGGQKRRVSLAIATIGNPKIVFLDEPTTGMDPKTRQEVWGMIKEMRNNRSVILTTHAMEEADILSDRIIVVSDGKLRAIGTPLYLKNSHGNSYRLSLILSSFDPQVMKHVKEELKRILPSLNSMESDASNIVVGISSLHLEELQQLFEILENDEISEQNKQFKQSIKEWSLSHATLEEVFMKLSDNCEQFQQQGVDE